MTQSIEELVSQLALLQIKEKELASQIRQIKENIQALFVQNAIPRKSDLRISYTDGSVRILRLQLRPGGRYFKVKEDSKDLFASYIQDLQKSFLDEGRAEMAEKASSWQVQEVKE